jgi:Undecaprenyl-phosphate glucose phosphotransferase
MQFWLTVALFSLPVVSFSLAGYIRFDTALFAPTTINTRSYQVFIILVSLLWVLAVEHLGLNSVHTLLTLRTGVGTAAKVSGYCTLLSLASAFFYRTVSFARTFVVLGYVLLFALSIVVVHLFRGVLHAMEKSPNGRSALAIVGADERAGRVAQHLSEAAVAQCRIACFVALPGQSPSVRNAPLLEWECLEEVVESYHCSEILICLSPERMGEAQQILQCVQHLCIPARMVLDLGEGIFVPERVFDYYGVPLLDVQPYPVDTVGYCVGKRIFDIVFSIFAILLSSPLMLVIALAIKLTSRGPVLFSQERISLNGRRFRMVKFRTMRVQDSHGSNEHHTSRIDPRVTPIGALLRHTSLDELPQFFNVLRGDMSVVGPRPEMTFFVQKFKQEIPWYMARHNVKCGITGWAQVNGFRGSDTSIPRRIEYDLYYMQHWSMLLDLRIILMTIFSGLVSTHAY